MMEFIGDAFRTFGVAASGGLTGLLGLVVRQGFEWLNRREERALLKMKQDHEIAKLNASAAVMREEYAANIRIAETNAESARDVANAQAFAGSFQTEPRRYATAKPPKGVIGSIGWSLMILVDLSRGLIRPGMTVYLVVLTTMMAVELQRLMDLYGMRLASQDVLALMKMILETVLYLTVTCVTWWFGVRQTGRAPSLQNR